MLKEVKSLRRMRVPWITDGHGGVLHVGHDITVVSRQTVEAQWDVGDACAAGECADGARRRVVAALLTVVAHGADVVTRERAVVSVVNLQKNNQDAATTMNHVSGESTLSLLYLNIISTSSQSFECLWIFSWTCVNGQPRAVTKMAAYDRRPLDRGDH